MPSSHNGIAPDCYGFVRFVRKYPDPSGCVGSIPALGVFLKNDKMGLV